MELDPSMWDSDIVINGIIIFILLLISGIFSGSETALTAVSKARLHQMSKRGNARAKSALTLISKKEKLLGAILLGNNLVNILASALATSLFLKLFGETGVIYATIMMTALVVIFAEVLPKTYAITNPDKASLAAIPLMRIVVAIFSPIVSFVSMIVRATFKLFGMDISKDATFLSAHEEIRGTLDLKQKEGVLEKEDRDMLGSILDLDAVTVEDVMTHRRQIEMLDADKAPDEIIADVVRSKYTRLPVFEGDSDNIIGMLHAKDVLRSVRLLKGNYARFKLKRVMKKPWFVPEATTLREQLNAFLSRHAHLALVVDEYGDIQGIVTLEDILEEIVGDITDEYDNELTGVRRLDDGSYLVEGTVTIRDLNRMFGWTLPDEEATTVVGLVIFEAETIPIVGQKYNFHGFAWEVTGRRRNQITQVRITEQN